MKHLLIGIALLASIVTGAYAGSTVSVSAQPASVNLPSVVASVDSSRSQICDGAAVAGANCSSGGGAVNRVVKAVLRVLSVLAGVLAVIMLVVAGLKYITSAGDAQKVASAKSAVIYAIVGLVIVALAQTIVHFVLKNT
jgi:hypothetical protein